MHNVVSSAAAIQGSPARSRRRSTGMVGGVADRAAENVLVEVVDGAAGDRGDGEFRW